MRLHEMLLRVSWPPLLLLPLLGLPLVGPAAEAALHYPCYRFGAETRVLLGTWKLL